MLPEPMKTLLPFLLACSFPLAMQAQVELNTSLELTGGDGQRGVDGLAPATSPTSVITVEASLLGGAHWAGSTVNEQTITLTPPVPVEMYRPGALFRFSWPAQLDGPILLQTTGLEALPLLRPDGLDPVPGQLRAGAVTEVVHAVDRWILLSPTERGCPTGSLPVHSGLCMDEAPSGLLFIYGAMDHCQARGGKLCTWDEYYLGCAVLAGQLTGMFQEWEWLDETSNHTHTGDQAGRTTCRSQRSSNPVLIQGRARCCYRPR